jgi:ATP-binding cassette subfamily F protein 3
MLVEPANTLLLDEPTNHLDPASVDVLTDALTDFPGTIVFISHDPTFLMRVSTRVVEIEDGQARDYHGDYEYYLWKRAQELESIKESSEDLRPTATQQRAKKSGKNTPPGFSTQGPPQPNRRDLVKSRDRLEKQVARAEAESTELETRVKARDQELADPALYQDFSRWNDLHQEQEKWRKDLDRLTATWTDLSQELEEVKKKLEAGG